MFVLKTLTLAAVAFGAVNAAPVEKRSTSGRGTFYDVGMGNCGWSNSASQYVVALNTAQYGSTSQVSGACGQTITINYNGKSAQAQIVDSCPTCPYGALDMSTSLFSYLTNGNMGLGEIQMSWSWGSGGGNSNSNSNNNNNNDNSNNNNDAATSSAKPTSTSQPTSTSTSTPSSTSSASSSATAAPMSTVVPTGTANTTVEGVPQWWASISTAGCPNVNVPAGINVAAISPSTLVAEKDLATACGKWVEVINPANNKTTKVVVTSYLPGTDSNGITLADAYKAVADMSGSEPNVIDTVKWGFIN